MSYGLIRRLSCDILLVISFSLDDNTNENQNKIKIKIKIKVDPKSKNYMCYLLQKQYET